MDEETRSKALELTCKLEKDVITAHETMDTAITGLKEAIDQIIRELNTDNEAYKAENTALEAEGTN